MSTQAASAPTGDVVPTDLLKHAGRVSHISAVGVLAYVVYYLLTTTIPAIQHDSAENRRVFQETMKQQEERSATRDGKIVDALLELKRDK